jgi:hypothetical protein
MGTVMWTALTGRELFADESYQQIVTNVLHKEIEPPSAFGAPACLDDLCMRALSRSRDARPASAEEMALALLKIGVENGLLASPAAVGAYVRREITDGDVERRRRIDAASQEAMASPAPAPPTVRAVPPTVTVSAPPASSEKKFAKTMLIPGRQGRVDSVKRWLAGGGWSSAKRGRDAKTWLSGSGVAFLALWLSVAVLAAVITVAIARHNKNKSAAQHTVSTGPSSVEAKGPMWYS